MKAMILKSFGSEMVYEEISRPVVREGRVLVKIAASGVNPLDVKISKGEAAHGKVTPSAILGLDMAGTVVEVASGSKFKVGDEVYGLVGGVGENQGTLAEFISADENLLALKPKNLSMRDAASVPLTIITAWEGLVDRAHVQKGQTVLVHGGAGGVGNMALQLAKANGATVFATGGSTQQDLIRSYGATPIDYATTTVDGYVKANTDSQGFDIVYDTLGGATLDASFQAVKQYTGHVVSCLGWGSHALAPLSFKSATYSGVFTLAPLLTGYSRAHHGKILSEATKLIEAGLIKPLVDERRFTLKEANEAHQFIATKREPGKVVVEII